MLSTAFRRLCLNSTSITSLTALSGVSVQLQSHRGVKDDFFILREPPVGPHRILPPNFKQGDRVGPKLDYQRIIHYPEDGKYTVKPLRTTKLAGRHPVTGRKVVGKYRGGAKQRARWIDWRRLPADWDKSKVLEERVLQVRYDPLRKPWIMLTGYEDKLRWQVATEGVKVGDIIRTSAEIPPVPVVPVVGDSYPLGALPLDTRICLIQKYPDQDEIYIRDNHEVAVVVRRVPEKNRIVVRMYDTFELAFHETCQCVVGQISIHPLKAMHIGSPNRKRWLGLAPASGLWQRKEGRHGRKIKAPPPVMDVNPPIPEQNRTLMLTAMSEGQRGRISGPKAEKKTMWPKTVW